MPFDAPNLVYGLSDGENSAYFISLIMIQSSHQTSLLVPTAYLQCRLAAVRTCVHQYTLAPFSCSSHWSIIYQSNDSPPICEVHGVDADGIRIILFRVYFFQSYVAYDWGLSKGHDPQIQGLVHLNSATRELQHQYVQLHFPSHFICHLVQRFFFP